MAVTPGTIIHISEYRTWGGEELLFTDAWAVATDTDKAGRQRASMVSRGYDSKGYEKLILGAADKWSVPDPSEWPDELCVAVAKHQLTGERLIMKELT